MATRLATTTVLLLLLSSLSLLGSPAAAQKSVNVGFGNPHAPERPGGPGAATATKDFRWKNPFLPVSTSPDDDDDDDNHHHDLGHHQQLKPSCSATRSFRARQYLLDDLKAPPPRGLGPYADRLKAFFQGRAYPGGWDGVDPHGYDRPVVLMEGGDVPAAVRAWIDEQQARSKKNKKEKEKSDDDEEIKADKKKKEDEDDLVGKGRLFAVYRKAGAPKDHKVVIFAPGAIYETLPLWVAEGSDCESTLLDLSKYTPEAADGAVVGWVTEHTSPVREKEEREMQFTIRVESLQLAEAAPGSSSSAKDEL